LLLLCVTLFAPNLFNCLVNRAAQFKDGWALFLWRICDMSFWKWSRAASSNATADGSINWAEGQAPSTVNDSARAMMAAAAKYRDDISGAIVTGGSATAYSVSSYQGFDTLTHLDGAMIAFTPHATNGATVTLNVDGLGARPLRQSPSGLELPAGALVQGTPYVATYYNVSGEWILRGFAGNPYGIPLGGMLEFTGTTAPNGSFVLPFGQAISRTTYAAYFAMVGTSYGPGDGSTTFNVIDKRGRVSAGKDDMGGSAASRITSAGSSIDGTTLGANGGAQTVTLAQANLPNVNFNVDIPSGQGSHNHTLNNATGVIRTGGGAATGAAGGQSSDISERGDAAGDDRYGGIWRIRYRDQQDAARGDRQLFAACSVRKGIRHG
jgi:microcystin-dependent protein